MVVRVISLVCVLAFFSVWMWSIVGVAVASSVADSTVLLAWICGGRASARNFTVRYVAFFALSNLVTCVSAILNNVLNNAPPTMICSGLAVAEWYGVFASWMWTAAIACAFRLCFRRGKVNPTRLEEVGMHLACWLLPAGLLGAAAALGSQFGAVDDGESGSGGSSTADSTALCGWLTEDDLDAPELPEVASDMIINGLLLGVFAFNSFAFLSVYQTLNKAAEATASAELLEGTASARRRNHLWRTFVAYLAAFVITQAPRALYNLALDFWHFDAAVATELVYCMSYSHGIVNAVVYGVTNRALWDQWRRWPPRCCCGGCRS